MKAIYNLFLLFVIITFLFTSCEDSKTGFAIVVDTQSYENVKAEIDAYAEVLEQEGLTTHLLVKDYTLPDSLRNDLLELYNSSEPIEGAVFIGDVPIPVAIDAQHMTSAFKMDQKHYGDEASVPTDRFYDDFDLIFDYIKQDSIHPLRHFYSLNYQSAQVISPDIYSGRIKMPEVENKYELLKTYMQKVVAAHQENNPFDQFFFFAGHGYNSESMVARLDEQVVLSQQLPGNPNINYMDHSRSDIIKFPYMSELQRPELDMAMVHHHGGEQTEYLSGGPKTDSYMVQIEMIKQYLRGRLQRTDDAKEMKEVKKSFMERYDLPSSWFDGFNDPEMMKKDSIFAADLDLVVEDFKIYDYKPNVRFIVFDACYNGSYHFDEYVAGSYISAFGKTVAAQGNTVNSIQDKWPQEFIGLLSLGMRVGEWNKLVCYLETHILGDPTYRFTSVDPSMDIQKLAVSKTTNDKTWLDLLDSKYIDVQAYALKRLYDNAYEGLSDLLLDTYKTSVYGSVRAECLILSSQIDDENFIEILKLALFDDYELIQRFAVKLAGDSGNEELIPSMIELGFTNMSERVEFNYSNNIGFFDDEKLLAEFDKQVPEVKTIIKAIEIIPQIREVFERSNERYDETVEVITNPESSQKSLYNNIRNLRNYNYHLGVPVFLKFLDESEDQELRQMLIEALGWFNLSVEKQQIIDYCNKLANDEAESEEIRQEAKKTVIRLS
jgi:hypothetical protein